MIALRRCKKWSNLSWCQLGLVTAWYAGNTLYNIFNKKATNMIHAHWFVACAQLLFGIAWSAVMWGSGMRKKPNLSAQDIASCIPIGLGACIAHAGSVLAMGSGSVRYEEMRAVNISSPSCSAILFRRLFVLIFSASLRYVRSNSHVVNESIASILRYFPHHVSRPDCEGMRTR